MPKEKVLNQDVAVAISRDPAYLDNILFVQSTKNFYLFDGRYYKQLSDPQMREMVWSYVRANFSNVNMTEGYVKDIIVQLGWCVDRRIEDLDTPYIALEDCLLDTNTFEFLPFSRDKVAIHLIEISSTDINQATPVFDNYLKTILVHTNLQEDPELITLIQEMFGYYLMNSLKAQVVFFLVGEGSNGKSIMLNILTALIGRKSCSAMSIQSLTTDKYMVSDLVGIKLNVCAEEESRYLRSDKFKALVSGDLTQAQRKYGGSFVFAPKAKYIFATNEMPTFETLNHGLRRRIKIIPFYRILQDHEQDKELMTKLKAELPGILGWAMVGGKRLLDNHFAFSQSEAIRKTMEDFAEGVSPALRFFTEEFQLSKISFFPKNKMYQEYREWAILNGRKPVNSTNFNKDITHNITGVEEKVIRIDGKLERCWNIERKILSDVPVDIDVQNDFELSAPDFLT